ncbi:alpha/beta hydrolase [bacterium]|nr:MAG: alpha/beta hydrolase [bacterium]
MKAQFEKYDVDENTILVGHSCGCAFLVRRLGGNKRNVCGLILVTPWKFPDKERILAKHFTLTKLLKPSKIE